MSSNHGRTSAPQARVSPYGTGLDNFVLRAIVRNKEAEVIIGEGHATIYALQDETGVYAGISQAVPGVQDRILTITGSVDSIKKAYSLIAAHLVGATTPQAANTGTDATVSPRPQHTPKLRILIPHRALSRVTGKDGRKLEALRESSGAHIDVADEVLPRSTECLVIVHGPARGVGRAVGKIAARVARHPDLAKGTVLFRLPGTTDNRSTLGRPSATMRASQLWDYTNTGDAQRRRR